MFRAKKKRRLNTLVEFHNIAIQTKKDDTNIEIIFILNNIIVKFFFNI